MKRPLIVCCSPYYGEGWRRLGPEVTGDGVDWVFVDDRPLNFWDKLTRRPMLRACLQAVMRASRGHARLLITQDPRATFLCALFCRILFIRVDHYVFSFNFPELPTGIRHRLMRYAFRQIKQFSVHSSMERDLYSRYFDIPKEKIRLRLWSIGVPDVSPDYPLEDGRYIASIGGNGRDYRTLIQAAKGLPEIPFVLVVRPESLIGLEVPKNVKAIVNAPFEQAMNIMKYSAFTVLPLSGSTVPCGHVTLVCAMHLAKTVVATDSAGIYDYVRSGYNGLLSEPFSPDDMVKVIAKLWADPDQVARLGENNHRFGAEYCNLDRMQSDLAAVLTHWGIPLTPGATPAEAFQSSDVA